MPGEGHSGNLLDFHPMLGRYTTLSTLQTLSTPLYCWALFLCSLSAHKLLLVKPVVFRPGLCGPWVPLLLYPGFPSLLVASGPRMPWADHLANASILFTISGGSAALESSHPHGSMEIYPSQLRIISYNLSN